MSLCEFMSCKEDKKIVRYCETHEEDMKNICITFKNACDKAAEIEGEQIGKFLGYCLCVLRLSAVCLSLIAFSSVVYFSCKILLFLIFV